MKKFSFLSFVLFSLLMSACDNSDDDAAPNVVGTWKTVSSESYNCDVASDNKVLTCGTYAWCVDFTLNADKTYEMRHISASVNFVYSSGTYRVAKGWLFLKSVNSSSETPYKLTVSGNTMITDLTSDTSSCDSKDTYERI
jgi:hypothetical protein